LQSAWCAEKAGEPASLVVAALLHDVGHMIHKLGEDPASAGVDDRHEALGAKWLAKRFPAAVSEPVRLHVAAKRYLCAAEPDYFAKLAPDSIRSLNLQGGPMTASEQAAFLAEPFAQAAIRLRRYDEEAKTGGLQTPDLAHFLGNLEFVAARDRYAADLARQGYVRIPGYWTAADQARLQSVSGQFGARAARILREWGAAGLARHAKECPTDIIVVAEASDPEQVCRFEYLLGADKTFADWVQARLTAVMSDLGGEPFRPFKDKENEKLPGGGAFGPHQDFAAYQAFGPRFNLTAMVAIDPQTAANGCLAFAANLQEAAQDANLVQEWVEGRPLLRFHDGGPLNGDIREEAANALRWDLVEAQPGDLVVFDSFVPHKSAPNGTAAPRRAMFLTYARAREGEWYERYYADKRANFSAPKFHVSTPTQASAG
jgi:predicted HD phosphohydrolase